MCFIKYPHKHMAIEIKSCDLTHQEIELSLSIYQG